MGGGCVLIDLGQVLVDDEDLAIRYMKCLSPLAFIIHNTKKPAKISNGNC